MSTHEMATSSCVHHPSDEERAAPQPPAGRRGRSVSFTEQADEIIVIDDSPQDNNDDDDNAARNNEGSPKQQDGGGGGDKKISKRPSALAGLLVASLADQNREAKPFALKPTVTHVTKRDGTVVTERKGSDGVYSLQQQNPQRAAKKDMSYLEGSSGSSLSSSSSRGSIHSQEGKQGKRNSSTNRLIPNDMPLDPSAAWEVIRNGQVFAAVPTVRAAKHPWKQQRDKNYTRIVCMSDTHGLHDQIVVPAGDVLVHAGDFTSTGEIETIHSLTAYFQQHLMTAQSSTPLQQHGGGGFSHIICIAGNHDLTVHESFYQQQANWNRFHKQQLTDWQEGRTALVNLVQRTARNPECGQFVFLEDAAWQISTAQNNDDHDDNDTAIQFYGSPWSPEFYDWAYNVPRGQASWDIWADIPSESLSQENDQQDDKDECLPPLDVLVTHGPPLGRGDLCDGGHRAGCHDLLWHVQERVKPRLHVFGHIHEGYGTTFDGTTLYVNASNLDLDYTAVHPCIVVDLPHDATQPACVVQPECRVQSVADFVARVEKEASKYSHLWNALVSAQWFVDKAAAAAAAGFDFPVGNALLDTADAYRTICSQHFLNTANMFPPLRKAVERDLSVVLSAIYAESFY